MYYSTLSGRHMTYPIGSNCCHVVPIQVDSQDKHTGPLAAVFKLNRQLRETTAMKDGFVQDADEAKMPKLQLNTCGC